MRNKSILITGGLGAIGSNLSRELCRNNDVVIVDDMSEGHLESIYDIREDVTFIKGDIRDDRLLKKVFSKDFDVIFHLAASFANEKSVRNPLHDADVNIMGTLKLLEWARKKEPERFLYASSSSSYGPYKMPVREDMQPHPSTPYALSKLVGEHYSMLYHNVYGVRTCAIRYFNSYGPGEYPGEYRNVIPNFFHAAMNGKPLKITGTGNETRDFTYIFDVIKGTVLMAIKEKAIGEVVNIGSGKETKIQKLAEKINAITGNKRIERVKRRSWDKVTRRVADIGKARRLLGYSPSVKLDGGLRKTYEWFKKIES